MSSPEKTRKSLVINVEMSDWLKKESEKQGISVNALINIILNDYKKRSE